MDFSAVFPLYCCQLAIVCLADDAKIKLGRAFIDFFWCLYFKFFSTCNFDPLTGTGTTEAEAIALLNREYVEPFGGSEMLSN